MKCSFEKENISSNQEEMESQYMICRSCEWFYNCDVAFDLNDRIKDLIEESEGEQNDNL